MAKRTDRVAEAEARCAALEAELALYRDAVEHMHQAFYVFDAEGRVLLSNSGFAKVLQLPLEAIHPGVTLRDLIELGIEAGHYPAEATADKLERGLWTNLDADAQARAVMRRDGRTYAVLPRRTAGGRFVGTFEDITAQVDTQNALRESEARMRAILDAMPDCVKIFAESGELVHINPAGLDLLQAPDLASLSAPGYAAVAPEYADRSAEVHRRVMAGETVMGTYEVVGLHGRRRHVEAHAVPFTMPDGSKAHLCISRDVSERIQAHEALRQSEARLRLIQDASGFADFEASEGGIARLSERFVEQTGLPPGTQFLTPKEWLKIVHPEDRARFERDVVNSVATAETVDCEFRIVRPDTGEVRWISSRTRRDDSADSARVIGAHLDITDRKLVEEELRGNAERLRLVHEATGLADFESDADGLSSCSDRFLEQFGLSPRDFHRVARKGWGDFIHPDDRDRLVKEIEDALEQRHEWYRCEFRIIRADNGQIRWIAGDTKMERDEHGNLIRTIGAHLDITERKEAENSLRRSEERLRLVQEATGLAHFESGPGLISEISEHFLKQTGLPPETMSLTPEQWLEIIHPDDRERFHGLVLHSIETHDTLECEFRIVRPDNGETRWLYSRCKIDRAEGGPPKITGAHLDITDRKYAEEALRESEERFRLAAEAIGLGVWDYDVALNRREWSDRLRQIFGIGPDVEPRLEAAKACIHPADRTKFVRLLVNARDNDVAHFEATLRIRRPCDGAERWVVLNGWRTFKTDSKSRRIIMTVRDITEQKTAERRVRWAAGHDTLTRLANRSMFQEKLDEAIRAAAADGGAVGLLMLDLDDFKQINDTLGHDAGDTLLRMFAERLRGLVRAEDTVARFGGDEFALVMPDIHTEQSVVELSRSLQDRLREPFVHGGRIIDCRVSMGASVFPFHGRNSEELLKNADIALYAAKAGGRAMVSLFEPRMRDDVEQRSSMVQLARDAIADDRIVPYYQPKLALADRSLVGFEALLRWRTPRRGIGAPAGIKAAFDDLDVAAQISDRMIKRVIADMRGWLDRGIDFKAVAVNASAAEFRRDSFAERLLEQLRRAEIPTRCFQLEVTETVFLGRGAEYVHRALALLNLRGVKIALDDFGTGYASLRHLKEFPVDVIKIDQSFVRDMAVDPGDEAIVRAVINLGRSLGIKVVAEGIEHEEQERRLLELDCDFGQGFLYSRAIPASRVPALVDRWPGRLSVRPPTEPDLRLVANRD
jgi:diguanylate cyclase (GGDEF)-like protein/PAS domain S-box-containing protein